MTEEPEEPIVEKAVEAAEEALGVSDAAPYGQPDEDRRQGNASDMSLMIARDRALVRSREVNESSPRPIFGSGFERGRSLASALANAIDAKGHYYPSHSQGVEQIARSIAEFLGFSPAHSSRVALAGLLHDLGKLLIPDRILLKPSALTLDEMEVMKMHVIDGERLLVFAGYGAEALWVRHHHCRWDGQGYPDHLIGEEIPLESRIIGVADAFHAMQSDRPYHRACSVEWAIAELDAHVGTQFCPLTVNAIHEMQKEI